MKENMYDIMYQKDKVHWWFRAKRKIVLGLIDKYYSGNAVSKVADFGCGCGLMLGELKRYGEVDGFDFSEKALDYCRKRFSGRLYQCDLSDEVKITDSYRLGVALDILEHIPNDKRAAKNIYHFLDWGGVCVITVPANRWMWSAHDDNCMHYRRYDKRSLQSLLQKAGFEVKYISYYNFFLFFPIAALRIISKCFHFDKDSKIENRARDGFINRMLYRIFVSERKRICRGKTFPCGVSLVAVVEK